MILNSNVSVQSKIQSYLRYGLRIAKKAEINKRLTNQDDYKQKMIEKYLDRAREIRNNGLYQIVRGQGGQKNLLYFEKPTRVVAQDLLKLGFTEKKQDMFPKDRGVFATDKKDGLITLEDLRIRRQSILNEMVRSKGDANKLHDLNLLFSRIDNELRLRNQ